MRAGELRERITVYRVGRTADTQGGGAKTRTLVGEDWAAVEAVSGREAIAAGQMTASLTHRVRMRYAARYAALTPKWEVDWRGRTLLVEVVQNVQARDREFVLLCVERHT